MKKEKKPVPTTIRNYRKWQVGKYALYGGIFASPMVPAIVMTIINWSEWFEKTSHSLPYGFACMLLTVILAVIGILRSDVVFKKVDIALFCLAGLFICLGLTNMFLAGLYTQLGWMWIYTGCGLLASGIGYLGEHYGIEPNLAMYRKLIEDNKLDQKSKRKQQREEQARKDAEEDAKRQAVE